MKIETRSPDGRTRIRTETGRVVYLYRLTAVAWGILDGLGDPRIIHHRNGNPWDTSESNLEAVEPWDHPRTDRGAWA